MLLGVGDVLGERRNHLIVCDVDYVDVAEVQAVEEPLHVGDRVDGHAALADPSACGRMIGIEPLVRHEVVHEVVEGLSEVPDHSLFGQQVHALPRVLGQPVADHGLVGPMHELVLGGEISSREGKRPGGADPGIVEPLHVAREVRVLER